MQIKKYFFLLIFITMLPLNACNLNMKKTESALSTETPIMETATFASMPTSIPTSTPTSTNTAAPTVAMPSLSPTPTLFLAATATPTQQWSACPGIVVTITDTNDGEKMHILRCEDGLEYDLGPLAKGIYAVGPNDKFLIYITTTGLVYIGRIGDHYLYQAYDLANERIFTVFNKNVVPDFKISFSGEAPNYRLILVEKRYDQKRMYELPPKFTY